MSTPTLTPTNTLLSKPPAALIKPLAPTASAQAATAAFAAKPKAVKYARQPKTLADKTAQYLKFLLYGESGAGKTLALSHLLEAGLTVLAVSTDFGGEGFTSVRQFLKERGNEHLLENCIFFELQDYDDVEDFVYNPVGFWPEIYKRDIDVVFFDGFSAFQQCLVSDKVLSMQAQGKAEKIGEAREAGLFANQQDWGAIRNASLTPLDKFLRMYNEVTGKAWSKVLTCLETDTLKVSGNPDEKAVKVGPFIQGAAGRLMEPCFDLIIRLRKKRVEKKIEFYYQMEGSDRVVAKSRGFKFEATEPGDFGKIWASACAQKGITAGKR